MNRVEENLMHYVPENIILRCLGQYSKTQILWKSDRR